MCGGTAGQCASCRANSPAVLLGISGAHPRNGPQVEYPPAKWPPARRCQPCPRYLRRESGFIGYLPQQSLITLREQGVNKPVVTIVTQVVVDANDPAFQSPPNRLVLLPGGRPCRPMAKGLAMQEDRARGGWRASFLPRSYASGAEAIISLIDSGAYRDMPPVRGIRWWRPLQGSKGWRQ